MENLFNVRTAYLMEIKKKKRNKNIGADIM